MNIKIIDNFANLHEQIEVINYLKKEHTFRLQDSTVFRDKNVASDLKNTIDNPMLIKNIFTSEEFVIDYKFFTFVYVLLHKNNLSNHSINRILVNTTFPYPKNTKEKHSPIHYDYNFKNKKCFSIIYYINNSDGDTVFFDNKLKIIKKVSPKQGRAVVFDSDIYHAGCCPINSPYRQVVNFILYK